MYQIHIFTNKILIVAAVLVLGLALNHQPSLADGTHGTKANCINKSDGKIVLYVFNGKDSARQVPHKTYTINKGENQQIKCHGEGKGRCWISNTLSSIEDDLTIKKGKTCDLKIKTINTLELKNCS